MMEPKRHLFQFTKKQVNRCYSSHFVKYVALIGVPVRLLNGSTLLFQLLYLDG